MVNEMPEEKKKDLRHPETFFLPPLKMFLSFFDKESRQREKKPKETEKQEETVGKNVEKLIEKLREKKE
jgi:hypothetical protein